MKSGKVVKAEIPHARPSGMEGFVFNTRRPIFADWRVRDALLHAFNYEFVNQTLNAGALPRRASYFANSALAMGEGPAEEPVATLLEPFAGELVPDALDAYALPVADGSPRNRKNMRIAAQRLEEAGWTVDKGVLRNARGRALPLHHPAPAGPERGRDQHLRRRPPPARDRGAGRSSSTRRSSPRARATTTTT